MWKFIAAATCVGLGGCAQYKVVGAFDDYNEIFVGDVQHNLLVGHAHIVAKGEVTGLTCEGDSYVTSINFSPACRGQRGEANLTCGDGRKVRGEWEAQSCTVGYGLGEDDRGNTFVFAFGASELEAKRYVRQESKFAEERPPLPGYEPKQAKKEKGFATGTGFFISERGHVLTNFHVVADSKELKVVTAEGKTLAASIVKLDPANDIALIRVDAPSPALHLGSAHEMRRGDSITALGYPLIELQGQEMKATFGRVNALSGAGGDVRYFQIDAPIQPGNSGGPVLDERGQVVGIATATASTIGVARAKGYLPQNVNYAVKASYARPLLESESLGLLQSAEATRMTPADLVEKAEAAVVLVIAR